MRLIPLTEFVKEQKEINIIKSYSKFLSQNLTMDMFIHFDENGKIWEEPKRCCSGRDCGCLGKPINYESQYELNKYFDLQKKILFKGFKPKPAKHEVYNEEMRLTIDLKNGLFISVNERGLGHDYLINKKIYALAHANLGLELTYSAINKIFHIDRENMEDYIEYCKIKEYELKKELNEIHKPGL